MEKQWAIIRGGYVVDVVLWDQENAPAWVYPGQHDAIVESPNDRVMIGDWYEADEGIFYRPITAPPDLPAELAILWT